MKNINPYNQHEFESQFQKTNLYQQMSAQYDHISFNKFFEHQWNRISSPRQQTSFSYMSVVPWYYFQYLNSDYTVYDLGCGCNLFKSYFDNLVGVGAELDNDQFFGDLHDFVDDEFYKNHKNYYQSVFSINALHFRPLENLKEICINFSEMLCPTGTGFLALNYQRLKEHSVKFQHRSIIEDEHWILEQFVDFPCELKVLDIDLSCADAWLDGNIRIVFKK